MDILEQLSAEQRDLLVRLPYRAGLWVSEADKTGGDESDAQERRVLHGLLHGFAGDVFGSEFIQHIMAGTLAGEARWTEWAAELDGFPKECERAIDILRSVTDEKEVKVYIARLMEIGEAVAMAYREHSEDMALPQKVSMFLAYLKFLLARRGGRVRVKSFDAFMQVSLDERKALDRMADALGTKYA
ncbi:MAG: hypothetical protein ACRBCT_08530 [Alphaproteobacteria bacterium]